MSTEPLALQVEPLGAEAFARFGDVVEVANAAQRYLINEGTAERFHDLARLDAGVSGKTIVSIFRGQPRELPFTVRVMEQHPLGSQTFIPLFGGAGERSYLVVVAPPGERPTAQSLRCFRARADQGVNFAAGVWHCPLLTLGAVSDFLVLDRAGPGDNCEEVAIEPGALIRL